ncbi:MAG: hydrogenase [Candidatus Latescibacteria bacterium]|nr:hydrogenase [Candidatus Latescibacterota bacterium]
MLGIWLILAAIILLGCSGLPGCLLPARSAAGQRLAVLLMVLGGLVGLSGVALVQGGGAVSAWSLPGCQLTLRVDALSAVFLIPVFLVPALGAVYGLGYWPQADHPENSRRLGLSYGLLAGAMALVVVAADGLLLLIAWEVMALAAFFAATAEEERDEVRRAGWVYLIATHLGTLCLIALFALWQRATGSLALAPAAGLPAELAGVLLVLAVVGFGFKAGLMPLHVWLPGAHANAPSHVSAVMSGVMLKMGVYGMVRMTGLLPAGATWWGGVLLAAGAISGVAGIAMALGQRDLKRLLAYSSIENIGIIAMGLGVALLGRSLGRPDWVVLGLGGALFHVWNHSLFKPLLFFNAGAVIHATHTRDTDMLGGLAKTMPQTAALFGVGAVAICALPPLNGFASEWLVYLGLFRTLDPAGGAVFPAAAVAAVALALIGALAVACFVKLLGSVFLGAARREVLAASDPAISMRLPMAIAAAGCLGIGLFPWLVTPLLQRAVAVWAVGPLPPAAGLEGMASLKWISVFGLGLLGLAGGLLLFLRVLPRFGLRGETGTWDCGYARPTARMQYTGTSFAQQLVQLFELVLWPRHQWPAIRGLFASPARFASAVPDLVLDRLVLPLFALAGRQLPRLRILQQGQTHHYVLYIIAVVIFLFVWGAMGGQP